MRKPKGEIQFNAICWKVWSNQFLMKLLDQVECRTVKQTTTKVLDKVWGQVWVEIAHQVEWQVRDQVYGQREKA